MDAQIGLLDAIPYLRAYAGQTFIVKASGELLEQPRWRDGVARDLAVLHRLGVRVIFVHGGGPQLSRAAAEAGLHSRTVAGRRVTSPELMALAVQIWRGRLSSEWIAALGRHGEAAVGLSGLDAQCIQAKRRPVVEVVDDDGVVQSVDFGRVGDLRHVRVDIFDKVLNMPAIPVVCPIAVGDDGEALNVNADTVAAELAIAMGAAKVILLTRAPGILCDPNDPASVLHWTDLAQLSQLVADGAILSGMRPKVAAIERALRGGVARVHVVDGREPGALLAEVFTTTGSGTLVVAEADACPAEPTGPGAL